MGKETVLGTGTCTLGIDGAAIITKSAPATTRHLVTSLRYGNPKRLQRGAFLDPRATLGTWAVAHLPQLPLLGWGEG